MGHDVQVSNMWQVRDLWNWLAPGWTQDREAARARASFVTYDRLQEYRDLSLRLEASSTPSNRRVGLWAKAYMSDKAYSYVGTVTTAELHARVVGHQVPGVLDMPNSEQKLRREKAVLKKFAQLQRRPYKDSSRGTAWLTPWP